MTDFEQNILETYYGNNDELILAHVIFRHGERNIFVSYPNDPFQDEAHWPGGFGQLTNKGKRQLHALGQYLRRRYNKLIGPKYSPNNVYVQSTDFDRTIMSAQAALAGMFSPSEEEKWHEEIMWHPIPVHTIPLNIDHVLTIPDHFPKFAAVRKQHMKDSPEIRRIFTEHADHISLWSRESGSNIDTVEKVYNLYNTLTIEEECNKPLPDWASKAIEPNGIMENIAKFYFVLGSNTRELAKLKSGPLIQEMMERFSEKINSTLKPNRSLWLYSAHDFTISNILNSLKLFVPHFPPTAASLHFELYKTAEGEHYFHIFYRKMNEEYPSPMKIPGCGEKCTLKQFYDLYKDIIPEKDSN